MMAKKPSNKYLVVIGTGGMGNRIENLLTCILYAKLTNRILFVDWSDSAFSKDGKNIFNKFFPLLDVDHVVHLPEDV